MKKWMGIAAGVVLAVLAVGMLGRRAGDGPIVPPDVVYGQDVCARCNMIISDRRFAAALVVREADGRRATHAFDDIGCAVEFQGQDHGAQVLAQYVADYAGRQWLDARAAAYVAGGWIVSPMGYGIAACADPQAAAALSKSSGGQVLAHPALEARIIGAAGRMQASAAADVARDNP